MKDKSIKRGLAAVLLGLLIPSAGLAANLVWDGSTATGYLNTDGTWGSDSFWCNQSAAGREGTVLIAWAAGNTAWFGGNAGIGSNAAPSGNFTVTVSGTQTVAGVRQIQNGDGNYTLTGGTLDVSTAAGVRVDTNTFTANSVLAGTNSVFQLNVQSASGILELGGSNTYSGTTEIRGLAGATVRLNNAGALGTGSALTFVNGSVTLDLNGQDISGKNATVNSGQTGFIGNSGASASTWAGNIALASSTANIRAGGTGAEVEVDGIISGDGTVQVMDGGTLRLTGANTYSNSTSVRDGGTLIVNNAAALGTTDGITYVQTGSKLNLNGFNIGTEKIEMQKANAELLNNAGTAATANGAISLSAAGQKIGGSGDLNLGGIISGTNGFTKTGAGALTLTGGNTYTGATVVSAGTLIAIADGALGFSNITVAGGATLTLTNGVTNNYINDSAALVLGTNSVLKLNFTGPADTVGAVSLDGGTNWLADGTYNAAALASAGGLGTYTGSGSLVVGGVFTLTGSVTGGNGTVSPTNAVVAAGGSTNFTVTAALYYRIASLTTNGTAAGSFNNGSTSTNFVWSNVQADGALVVTFTNQVANDPAGTPYTWLAGYGLTNFDADAAADQDADGLKTWQEYIAGTNPTNAASCLKVAQATRNTVTWSPVTGRVYSVYWSTNLVKGFTNLADNIVHPQGSYTNTAPDAKVNHYQVRVRMQ